MPVSGAPDIHDHTADRELFLLIPGVAFEGFNRNRVTPTPDHTGEPPVPVSKICDIILNLRDRSCGSHPAGDDIHLRITEEPYAVTGRCNAGNML